MDPVTLTLMGASLGGGILDMFGGKKKGIDPNWLKKHFGAGAVNAEMVELFNQILNSPIGQNLMTSAAEQGQQFGNDVARGQAAAGFGPGSGADSGSSIFANSASQGATGSFQRGVRSDVMNAALPVAQQMVNSRMQAAVQGQLAAQGEPSPLQRLGQGISRGANVALQAGMGAPQAQTGLNAVAEGMNPDVDAVRNFEMGAGMKPEGYDEMLKRFRPRSRGMFSRLGSGVSNLFRRNAMSSAGAQ